MLITNTREKDSLKSVNISVYKRYSLWQLISLCESKAFPKKLRRDQQKNPLNNKKNLQLSRRNQSEEKLAAEQRKPMKNYQHQLRKKKLRSCS